MLNTSNSSNQPYYYQIVIRFFSIYALVLVIVGTLGNLLTIIISCRKNLRRYVTMRYLIAVSVCDIISLYGWNLNNFYKYTISSNYSNLEEISLAHCRIMSYMTFVGLQLSSWCLTAVSIGRFRRDILGFFSIYYYYFSIRSMSEFIFSYMEAKLWKVITYKISYRYIDLDMSTT
jgi:hypothetical protein